MTHKVRIIAIVGVLVSVIMLEGRACATSTVDLRRIVIFKSIIDLTTEQGYGIASSVVTASGSTEVHNLQFINALAIALPAANATGALQFLRENTLVAKVSEDAVGLVNSIAIAPVDPVYDWRVTWGMRRIGVPKIRQSWPALPVQGVQVAVLDTGIDKNHPALNVVGGYNALPEGGPFLDLYGHGTHMAGIIGALDRPSDQPEIIGVAPGASLWAVKVCDQSGFCRLSDVIKGMQWVYHTNNGAPGTTPIRLANISLQFYDNYLPLERATQRLAKKGVIMVAAAGNFCSSGPPDESGGDDAGDCNPSQDGVAYPAAYPGVIAVGAINYTNQVTSYSQSGSGLDIVVPGGSAADGIRILSTIPGGGLGYGSGTSQATAHVTGICVLALALRPWIPFEEVLYLLKLTAMSLMDPQNPPQQYPPEKQGAGLSDAEDLVEAVQALP